MLYTIYPPLIIILSSCTLHSNLQLLQVRGLDAGASAPWNTMVTLTLLITAAAFEDTVQEEKLAALEAENLRLRVHLSQELDLLEKINEQQRRRLKQQEAERRPGPRRRLSAAGGSGGTGNFLHKGTVHSFADAGTCLGTDGPLTVHNTAGVPSCDSNNTPRHATIAF